MKLPPIERLEVGPLFADWLKATAEPGDPDLTVDGSLGVTALVGIPVVVSDDVEPDTCAVVDGDGVVRHFYRLGTVNPGAYRQAVS